MRVVCIADLHEMAANLFGNLVKAVVDVKRGLIVVDAELDRNHGTQR